MKEYRGIITGIGAKDEYGNVTNEITPEIDATVRQFTFNESGILDGLQISGDTLTKGHFLICGYEGTLENDIQNIKEEYSGDFYIYGVIRLNFDKTLYDTCSIVVTNVEETTHTLPFKPYRVVVEPTEITEEGIYYIKLYDYVNSTWTTVANIIDYPKNAAFADTTSYLEEEGIIGENATAYTAPVNSHNDSVRKLYPATTEYVRNQIEEELQIDETGEQTLTFVSSDPDFPIITGTYRIKRKAKMAIMTVNMPVTVLYSESTISNIGQVPSGFRPKTLFETSIASSRPTNTITKLQIQTNGQINIIDLGTGILNPARVNSGTYYFGYETN